MYNERYLNKTLFRLLTVLAIIIANKANAQLSGLQSIYFMNQYLTNPAMAGMEKGLTLNIGYQQQWTTVPGGPKIQNFTADYNSGNKVGLGINVSSNQAGLINLTNIMATYAYHLQLNETNDQKLNFGLSLGVKNTYIDYAKIRGDQDDMQPQYFNQRSMFADGDFGVAYTSKQFTFQVALPNLKSIFGGVDANNTLAVDRSSFFTAASYKLDITTLGDYTLEPKVVYRGFKGLDNILDAGLRFGLSQYNIDLSGFYHTNQSVSLGVGFNLSKISLLISYTNDTGPLRTFANNTFEFGAKVNLFR
jgi:type IX secretion system PorP/SprF family membrane protein